MAEEANLVQQMEKEYDPREIYQRKIDPYLSLRLIRQCVVPQDAYKSPLLASDDLLKKMPPLAIVCSATDCFLDDGVEMAKRLHRLEKNVVLHVLEDLPHAFLNFCFLGGKMQEATNLCRDIIKDLYMDRLLQPKTNNTNEEEVD
ncbi:hypothetical protein Ciccas_000272 [Cichlidogyrus casuarinus]|uniref:Alpha/beta hydrolase fold-3 domain-containing protein n=1 Tax=Cichlidogyrus casuarinus TaxID=1844966 RepID=A0ABD2QNG7_9PLAT